MPVNPQHITLLRQLVEESSNHRIETSTDFIFLSGEIQGRLKESLSPSTLKRLWGYVSLNPTPRIATLDVLSRFVGHRDFKAFCNHLKESQVYASNFFTARCQTVAELKPEAIVHIGWAPNRLVKLRYDGDYQFVVLESENSQLQPDDKFELSEIIVGYPLYISRILRDGAYTPSYVAGHIDGISLLKVETVKG